MNHDYAHCLDYTKDCPKDCFRAELQRDIEENRSMFIGVPLAYSHFRDTEECKLVKEKKMDDTISRKAAIKIIQSMYPGMPRVPWMREDWQKRYEPYIRTENAIRELPSAQSEIIRCKNCAKRKYCRTSTVWAVPPNDDWYCADAAPYKGEEE